MKWILLSIVATVAALVFGVLYLTQSPETKTVTKRVTVEPCGEQLFGHIASFVAKGDHYEMQFDPALMLSGETANTAAAEDGAVEPGEPVPNDNYVVDESKRTYLYLVPKAAKVTVLTNQKDAGDMWATPISTAELAQLLAGETPVKLFEGLDTGFHIRVHVDTVCSLDQQYHP